MLHIAIWTSLTSLLLSSQAMAARSEFVLAGDMGNTWQVALTENPGFYVVYGNDGLPIDTVAVAVAPRGVGADTLIDYSSGGMQAFRIDPTWNLARRLELGSGRITSSQSWGYLDAHLETIVLSYDGDPKTATFRTFVQDPDAVPGIGPGWRENLIVDLGADFPVNRVRFFPRLGDDDELIIEQMAEPKPDRALFGTESFSANYLEWYEISVADNTRPFSKNPQYFYPGTRWFRYNLQGQLLRTLVERPALAGRHLKVWDGRNRNGRQVASGIYLYRLQAAGRSATKKMLLLR